MKQWWVYGVSLLMTTFGIGGTLFFFMKTPSQEMVPPQEVVQSMSTEPEVQNVTEPVMANPQEIEAVTKIETPKLEEETNVILPLSRVPETAAPVSEPSSDVVEKVGDERVQMALQLKSAGDFLKAKEILKEVIQSPQPVANIEAVEKAYWDTNANLIFSQQQVEGWTGEVVVEKGDSLSSIAKRYNTTVELLMESNQLKNTVLMPGQKLRIFTGAISILVDKSLNTLTLKVNGEVVKVYSVGTGVEGSTPTGDFKIINKLENPPWHHQGKVVPFGNPENILGTRWLGFDLKGYGIHGTWDPASIGSQSSAGCVRLKNEEVEELYKIVPVGTTVTVVE